MEIIDIAIKWAIPTILAGIFAHITKELKVKVGDKVTRGKQIGYMGNSGSSTGTHLHFAIQDQNNNYLNPCKAAFSC